MIDCKSLSPAEYMEAKRSLIRGMHVAERQRHDEATLARVRKQYPVLAAAADASEMDDYRLRVRNLVAAEITMNAAHAAKIAAAREPSLYGRELAAQALAAAVEEHDGQLRQVVAMHAKLPQSQGD